MKKKVAEVNVTGVPGQKTQESLEGLSNTEVRNLNSEVEQSAPNGEAESNRLVEGVSSGTSPTASIGAWDVINETSEDLQKYWEHRANPIVRNADNELLGAMHSGGLTIGYVEEVNGPGAEEVQGFLPTRHELMQLAKYWAKVEIDINYFYFCYQQTGSTEIRRGPFARRRVARIADVLGEEVVKKAVDDAYVEYGKDQDPRTWNTFLSGTPEERKALQDEIAREICGDNAAQADSGLSGCDIDPVKRAEKAA